MRSASLFRTTLTAAALLLAAAVVCLPGRAMAASDAPGVAAELFDGVDRMAGEVDRAMEIYRQAKQAGTPEAIAKAEDALAQAKARQTEAEARLDAARVAALAQASGQPEAKIIAMRESGMGWGVIAKELGVSPSLVAHGKNNAASGAQKNKSQARKENAKAQKARKGKE